MPFIRGPRGKILRGPHGRPAKSIRCCCKPTLICQIFGTTTPYNLRLSYSCPSIASHDLTQTLVVPNYQWAGTAICIGGSPESWGVNVSCFQTAVSTWTMSWASSAPGAGSIPWTQIAFFRGTSGPGGTSYIKFKATIAHGCCGGAEVIATLTRP